ncbi:hypothetical protein FQA39_LY18026 [Lamprigera yunnana]|nr:hypothetical protein FQA39_LY18026 [Lamprigera yunnana]
MGTPIRRLFPNILSPLSRSPTRTKINNQSNVLLSRKRFYFDSSSSSSLLTPNKNVFNTKDYRIKVTDCSNKLLINSPNKRYLMNWGIETVENLNVLGRGTFGIVVSGLYRDSRVAVKIVKVRKKLKDRNALNLNHKNVVKIIDVVSSPNCVFEIVLMEYYERSRHLQSVIDDLNINLNMKNIVKYGLDICEGLQYCHDNQLLHLDLKPTNVILCENHICKLCDFGNSIFLDRRKQENFYLGTVMYVAPELFQGELPTVKCDVYSLGILLWQLRYRKLPHANEDGSDVIIYKVVKYDYRPTVSSEDRDEYFSIFSSCWSAEAERRPELFAIIEKLTEIRNL